MTTTNSKGYSKYFPYQPGENFSLHDGVYRNLKADGFKAAAVVALSQPGLWAKMNYLGGAIRDFALTESAGLEFAEAATHRTQKLSIGRVGFDSVTRELRTIGNGTESATTVNVRPLFRGPIVSKKLDGLTPVGSAS